MGVGEVAAEVLLVVVVVVEAGALVVVVESMAVVVESVAVLVVELMLGDDVPRVEKMLAEVAGAAVDELDIGAPSW